MHQNPMEQKRIDDIADEWQRWGRASATEQWARCVRCIAQEPMVGMYYCQVCLAQPRMVWKHPAWNCFAGVPNPRPYTCDRIPYDRKGQWESWTEWEYDRLPRYTGLRLWWEHVLLTTHLYRVRNWWRRLATQPGWNDERAD